MKRILLLLSLLPAILLLSSCSPVARSEPRAVAAAPEPRTITTTGDAEVRVTPDEVVLILGVETAAQELGAARSQNDERVRRVLAAAQEQGVEAKYLQTEYLSLEPRYNDSYTRRDLTGYVTRKTIVVTLKDIGKFENLLTAALEAGANNVHGVQFRTTELRRYRDQARSLAIKAAQEKAVALAAELGQKVGQPLKIEEQQSNWWAWYGGWWGGGWSSAMTQNVVQNVSGGGQSSEDATIAPGQITVNARVAVTFELE
jgi:uncharacterized protein YggE